MTDPPRSAAPEPEATAAADDYAPPAGEAMESASPRPPWPLGWTLAGLMVGLLVLDGFLMLGARRRNFASGLHVCFFGSLLGQVGLAAIWVMLGRPGLLRRLVPWLVISIVVAMACAFVERGIPIGRDVVFFFWLVLSIESAILASLSSRARLHGWRWTAAEPQVSSNGPLQFTLAQLFALVTVAAVLCGLGRFVELPKGDAGLWVIMGALGACLAVATAAGFVACAGKGIRIGALFALLVAPAAAGWALVAARRSLDGGGPWSIALVPVVAAWETAAIVLILRRAGMKLVRLPARSNPPAGSDPG